MSTLNKEKNLSKRIDVALAKKDYKKTFKNTDSLNIYYRVGTEITRRFNNWCGLRMDNRSVA